MKTEDFLRALAVVAGLAQAGAAPAQTGWTGAAPPAGGSQPRELCGTWQQSQSLTNGVRGGTYSGARFTLFPDGRYTFESERSMSAYTDAAIALGDSASSDAGRWFVSGDILTAVSHRLGTQQFQLSKRNLPNGVPMLCLNGTCFASAVVRPSW